MATTASAVGLLEAAEDNALFGLRLSERQRELLTTIEEHHTTVASCGRQSGKTLSCLDATREPSVSRARARTRDRRYERSPTPSTAMRGARGLVAPGVVGRARHFPSRGRARTRNREASRRYPPPRTCSSGRAPLPAGLREGKEVANAA